MCVWYAMVEMLFEALHFHGELKQFKIGLPLAFSELPKQNIFQEIKRLI
jgi:hypothetical protein